MPIKLDFSATQDNDFSPLDAGTYDATIFTIEQKLGRESKQPYLEFTYQLSDGSNRRLWQNFSLQPQALWKLKQHLVALGQDPEKLAGEFEFDPRKLLGTAVAVSVVTSTWQGSPSNDVTEVQLASTGKGKKKARAF